MKRAAAKVAKPMVAMVRQHWPGFANRRMRRYLTHIWVLQVILREIWRTPMEYPQGNVRGICAFIVDDAKPYSAIPWPV